MTITLTDAHTSTEAACESHPGWPLHIATECDRLAGVRPYTERIQCSVCDLDWGRGAVSQHESCASLVGSERIPAHPVTHYLMDTSEAVEIRFDA